MTKNTKNLLMLGGVVVVGYLLWKKYGKGMMSSTTTTKTSTSATSSFTGSDDFFNASGMSSRTRSGDEIPNCPSCSKGGECWSTVPRTDVTIAAGIAGQRSLTTCTPTTTTSTVSPASRR